MCDIADGTCPIWEERELTARKAHACMACRQAISPGHRYHRVDSMFEGHWDHWVHCLRCWAIYDAIRARLPPYEPICIDPRLNCGELWADPPPEVAALAFLLPGEPVPEVGGA